MPPKLFAVTNVHRSKSVIIFCVPDVEVFLRESEKNGIIGSKIVLNHNGFEINTSTVLGAIPFNTKLMVLTDIHDWTLYNDSVSAKRNIHIIIILKQKTFYFIRQMLF